jgi:hypothetical protein
MKGQGKKFSWRGWTTFVTTISFIVDLLSGIILYIAPPGRVANWTNWQVWGLSKDQWGAIHTIFGYVLLFIIAVHIYYNWKMLWNFIWSKVRKAMNLRKEMVGAAIICLIIFMGTLWEMPPFSSTMDLGDYFKDSWEENKVDTPIAHGELLSLQEFANTVKVPVDQIMSALKSKGYKVKNVQQPIVSIAKENNTSPSKLYEVMKVGGVKPETPKSIEGSGMGRKTLEMISSERGLPLEEVLARLKKNGIEAKPKDKLKEIAGRAGKTPMEIFGLIEAK